MNAGLARQEAGSPERQSGDTVTESGVFARTRLCVSFLEANLAQLGLQALTAEAVRAADGEPAATLVELAPGEPGLRHGEHLLGGVPSDEELAALVKNDDNTVYIVFGLGLGHTARALRAYTQAPIVIFEPDPAVLRAVLELGPADFSHFDIVSTSHDLTQIWPSVFSGRQAATVVNTPGYLAAYPDASADLRTALTELVQRSRVNDQTHRLRARDWVSDVLANVELLGQHPGFLALAGKYRGVPAFIVGAGPSLGKNGHELLQAQKKGIVFAVNSSARALDKLGVRPQVLACMESIDVSHLLTGLSFIDSVVRAFSLTAHPSTLRTGAGPLLPLWESVAELARPLKQLTGFEGVPVSGSVSTLAFALAHRLGCSPIVFVGQDLAYTDGRAYAPGTAYEASSVTRSADGRKIEMQWCDTLKRTHNINGRPMHDSEPLNETTAWGGNGKVLTSIGFSAVRAWLAGAALVLGRETPELRLVNATEGGARIDGYEERTLASLLAELPDRDITAESLYAHARAESAPLSLDEIANWAELQARAVEKARHVARRIQRLARSTLGGIKNGSANVVARLGRLEAAEHALSRAVAAAPLLEAWSWSDVDRVMAEREARPEDAQESAERALGFEARLGSAIDGAARALEGELAELAKRLRRQAKDTAPTTTILGAPPSSTAP